jgi:Tfp pilus assembly protein PilO
MPQAPNPQRRYNSWFVTVPLLVGCAVYFCYFYRPTQQAIRDMQAEVEVNRTVLATAKALPAQITHARQELAAAKQFVAAWRETAAHRRLPSVYERLSAIVAEAGAQGAMIVPEPAVRQRFITRVPVTLSCRGSYPQVFRIVSQIQQLPQTLWIDDLRVSRERKTAGDVVCELKLVVFTDQSNLADNSD